MQEYLITRYSFDELSDESKAVAIETERTLAHQDMPEMFLTEELRQILADELYGDDYALGLEINYDLSYSQGSGVSFTGELTRTNAPKLTWPEGASYAQLIRTDSHYSHAYTVRAELFDVEGDYLLDSPAVELFRDQIRDTCKVMERKGYAWIDDYTSEANAIESLKEAGDIFLESGKVSIPQGVTVRA